MRNILAVLTVCLTPVAVQADPIVVELYTSQGCSSCPPADALLHELAQDDDVIALALHVDYWDFIGWPDTFARAEHGKRQKDYAAEMGSRVVYTPQMIINGVSPVQGSRPMDVMKALKASSDMSVRLAVASTSDGSQLKAKTDARFSDAADIHLVTYLPPQTVNIRHGENAGKTISYGHVVSDWENLGAWDGAEEFQMMLPDAREGMHRVVLVQATGPGAIYGALRID